MSFRDIRNFTEIMKNLGYPRLISMENFREPNFLLVHELLIWLVERYEPNMDFPESIETLENRIDFLKAIGQLAYYKARIKLNLKRLYSADGYSIRELLKLARVLNNGVASAKHVDRISSDASTNMHKTQTDQFNGFITSIRDTSEELTELGAALDESLEKELTLRDARANVISQQHDPDTVRETVESSQEKSIEMIKTLREGIEQMKDDEQKLEVQKKRLENELEGSKNRLNRNKHFRPQFMDQYEVRVKELQVLYTTYVDRYRNLKYLENELEKYRLAEEEIIEENNRELASMRKKLHEEEVRYMRGESHVQDEAPIQPQRTVEPESAAIARPRAASGRRGAPPPRAVEPKTSHMTPVTVPQGGGSMFDKPANDEEESTDDDSDYSDSETGSETGSDSDDFGSGSRSEYSDATDSDTSDL